ncbi:MAG: cyclic nucleotide-binding domain-containing protein [Actinobacteria bacterium]|nr:cyclic nucleotide-binding domain-containing protein [Actinomycetota bacterium]
MTRIESSVTAVSWIPSQAVDGGLLKLPFELKLAHYDQAPPDALADAQLLIQEGRVRFANVLRAAIEVEDGRIVQASHLGRSYVASTRVGWGRAGVSFAPVPFPDLRPDAELGTDAHGVAYARFLQTAGGRTGSPSPRTTKQPPYLRVVAPPAWTTLALTLYADGRVEHEVVGASPFPRHWVYTDSGRLVGKTGSISFTDWIELPSDGERTPWGDEEHLADISDVETVIERELSRAIMQQGRRTRRREIEVGETLVTQGDPGREVYLLLDGILQVEVDGSPIAEVGPGAILGEHAALGQGRRTATLRAVTRCRVAVASAEDLDHEALAAVAREHRREVAAGDSN